MAGTTMDARSTLNSERVADLSENNYTDLHGVLKGGAGSGAILR
jgi:hypothetical protein